MKKMIKYIRQQRRAHLIVKLAGLNAEMDCWLAIGREDDSRPLSLFNKVVSLQRRMAKIESRIAEIEAKLNHPQDRQSVLSKI